MKSKTVKKPTAAYIGDSAAVLLLLILPLINAVLRLIYSSVAGDVLLTTYANILSVISYILSSFSLYAGLGFATRAVFTRTSVKKYPIMYFVGLVLFYAGDIMSNRLMMTDEAFAESLTMALTTALLNIMLEVVMFTLTHVFVSMYVRRRGVDGADSKTRVSLIAPVVCAANSMAWAVASTVVDLVTVGLPINVGEVVYLVSPYLLIAVTFVGGFVVVRLIGRGQK